MPRNFSELKSGGGTIPMLSPHPEMWGGGRVPPSPTDRRPCACAVIKKQGDLIGIDWSIEIGRFLGDTGGPNAFEHESRSTIHYYNMRLMPIFSLWTSKLCGYF